MAKNDNPPAFPRYIAREQYEDDRMRTVLDSDGGMSLREWFAGQALMGLLASGSSLVSFENYAKCAWQHADAMLAAREQDK